MRFPLLAIVSLAAASSVFAEPPKPEKGGIVWEANYDQAKAKAAGEGKLLFVEFLTDSCPTCKQLEAETFPRDEAKAFLADKVCVRVNPGKGADQKKRMDDFGVKVVPTMILISPEGQELVRAAGAPAAGTFVSYFVNKRWNDMIAAETAKDWKATAEHAFLLKTWFPGTEATERAESMIKEHGGEADFTATLEAQKAANDRAILLGKANLLVQDKKKKTEAIDAYKAVLAAYPDSKEAEEAKLALKKLGVKLDAPPKK